MNERSEHDERDFGGPGWEKEHSVDHADYLDSIFDEDDPFHEEALKSYNEERARRG
ncbi:MAG: hypothetical protein GY926_23010 [bacterium]|nr:hypothetical protein [bacterium]